MGEEADANASPQAIVADRLLIKSVEFRGPGISDVIVQIDEEERIRRIREKERRAEYEEDEIEKEAKIEAMRKEAILVISNFRIAVMEKLGGDGPQPIAALLELGALHRLPDHITKTILENAIDYGNVVLDDKGLYCRKSQDSAFYPVTKEVKDKIEFCIDATGFADAQNLSSSIRGMIGFTAGRVIREGGKVAGDPEGIYSVVAASTFRESFGGSEIIVETANLARILAGRQPEPENTTKIVMTLLNYVSNQVFAAFEKAKEAKTPLIDTDAVSLWNENTKNTIGKLVENLQNQDKIASAIAVKFSRQELASGGKALADTLAKRLALLEPGNIQVRNLTPETLNADSVYIGRFAGFVAELAREVQQHLRAGEVASSPEIASELLNGVKVDLSKLSDPDAILKATEEQKEIVKSRTEIVDHLETAIATIKGIEASLNALIPKTNGTGERIEDAIANPVRKALKEDMDWFTSKKPDRATADDPASWGGSSLKMEDLKEVLARLDKRRTVVEKADAASQAMNACLVDSERVDLGNYLLEHLKCSVTEALSFKNADDIARATSKISANVAQYRKIEELSRAIVQSRREARLQIGDLSFDMEKENVKAAIAQETITQLKDLGKAISFVLEKSASEALMPVEKRIDLTPLTEVNQKSSEYVEQLRRFTHRLIGARDVLFKEFNYVSMMGMRKYPLHVLHDNIVRDNGIAKYDTKGIEEFGNRIAALYSEESLHGLQELFTKLAESELFKTDRKGGDNEVLNIIKNIFGTLDLIAYIPNGSEKKVEEGMATVREILLNFISSCETIIKAYDKVRAATGGLLEVEGGWQLRDKIIERASSMATDSIKSLTTKGVFTQEGPLQKDDFLGLMRTLESLASANVAAKPAISRLSGGKTGALAQDLSSRTEMQTALVLVGIATGKQIADLEKSVMLVRQLGDAAAKAAGGKEMLDILLGNAIGAAVGENLLSRITMLLPTAAEPADAAEKRLANIEKSVKRTAAFVFAMRTEAKKSKSLIFAQTVADESKQSQHLPLALFNYCNAAAKHGNVAPDDYHTVVKNARDILLQAKAKPKVQKLMLVFMADFCQPATAKAAVDEKSIAHVEEAIDAGAKKGMLTLRGSSPLAKEFRATKEALEGEAEKMNRVARDISRLLKAGAGHEDLRAALAPVRRTYLNPKEVVETTAQARSANGR